ncbi:MAG: YihY/virulence factor BrkB family protein [Deltaproteobacteria bacterium]|nr:YihY/virulence factor BrkB family protein [Deltaproteobacteria bacterium]
MDIKKAVHFFKTEIWRIRKGTLPRSKWFLVKLARIIVLSIRGLGEDRCQLRAASLTLYSLLSIVPVAAVLFGIAKGFGLEKMLQKHLIEKLEGQEEIVSRVLHFAQSLLENVKGGLIAGIGVVLLFYAIIKLLSNIEHSFNDIWGVKKARTIPRKISDYLSLMLICPFLFLIASTMTVIITSQIEYITGRVALFSVFSPVIFFLLKFLPYCVLWFLFGFIYIFMPNTKVNFRSGAIAGIIAGSIFQVFQLAYITFQIGVSKYNAIYGSFAALPLFLIWMQVSWLIVLLGAEISFSHQNVDTYEFEPDCLDINYSFKRLLTLRICNYLIKRFSDGQGPADEAGISHELEIPIRLVRQILYELAEADVISKVYVDDSSIVGYQPFHDVDKMTIKYVMDALENHGTSNIPVVQSKELDNISRSLASFSELIEKSTENKLLKNL